MSTTRLGTTTCTGAGAALATALLLLCACGSEQPATLPPALDAGPGPVSRYLPLAVGATWTYHEVDTATGFSAERVTTVEAFEDVGPSHPGMQAFRVRVDKLYDSSTFWEGYQGDLTVRYRNDDFGASGALVERQSNAPARLKLDESAAHLSPGTVYTLTWLETSTDASGLSSSQNKTEQWSVIAARERVTVPLGTFDDVLHVRRLNTESAALKTKDYWYVRGIGKIKELGGGQSEELTAYTTP